MKSEEKEAWSLCTINSCVDTHEALYTFVSLCCQHPCCDPPVEVGGWAAAERVRSGVCDDF